MLWQLIHNKPISYQTMRCGNCGWENPDGQMKCEKCHGDLSVHASPHNPTNPVSDRMKSTVSENAVFNASAEVSPKTCPKCGYPMSDASTVCPNCNHVLQSAPTTKQQSVVCKSCGAENEASAKYCSSCGVLLGEVPVPATPRRVLRAGMGTVMSGPIVGSQSVNKFCTLKPIAWEGECVDYNPITYTGDIIVLNRANTDPNNNSITSREQAVLSLQDGEWYIENRSELRTTFIRVSGKVKLNSGDIIVLGNREFEFKG